MIKVAVPASAPVANPIETELSLPKTTFSINSFGLTNMNPFSTDTITGQLMEQHSKLMEMKDKIDGLHALNSFGSTGGMASDLADDSEFLMTKEHHQQEPLPNAVRKRKPHA